MRRIHHVLIVAALLSAQPAFADMMSFFGLSEGKSCEVIAKSCQLAGYSRDEKSKKPFWKDCMKPIIMDKSVKGVSIDAAKVKDCRMHKISEMQKELKELQDVK